MKQNLEIYFWKCLDRLESMMEQLWSTFFLLGFLVTYLFLTLFKSGVAKKKKSAMKFCLYIHFFSFSSLSSFLSISHLLFEF